MATTCLSRSSRYASPSHGVDGGSYDWAVPTPRKGGLAHPCDVGEPRPVPCRDLICSDRALDIRESDALSCAIDSAGGSVSPPAVCNFRWCSWGEDGSWPSLEPGRVVAQMCLCVGPEDCGLRLPVALVGGPPPPRAESGDVHPCLTRIPGELQLLARGEPQTNPPKGPFFIDGASGGWLIVSISYC